MFLITPSMTQPASPGDPLMQSLSTWVDTQSMQIGQLTQSRHQHVCSLQQNHFVSEQYDIQSNKSKKYIQQKFPTCINFLYARNIATKQL